ncbi:MAG: choice-of-anchor Q domain-containing protein [Planctomycetota bacterium]
MLRRRVVVAWMTLLGIAATTEAAELSVSSITIGAGQTDAVVVSGDIQGEDCFAISIILEIVPQGGNTGTLEFTPSGPYPPPTNPPIDIFQINEIWPGVGHFEPLDTGATPSTLVNAAVDDDGDFVAIPLTFTGDIAGFPVVASGDASGVWDVVLDSFGGSTWDPEVPTTLTAGTITVSSVADLLYVDNDAPGGGDGTSWATAYNDLQDALADAGGAGGAITEIRVAAGTYTPAAAGGDRTATFQLLNGLALNGGYAGFGQPDPDERGILLHETILSGDLNGDDDTGGDNTENSYHVVTGSGTDGTAVIDGCTISGGNADGPGSPDFHDRGGGMYTDGGTPAVAQCRFEGNAATFVGGGIYNNAGGSVALANCSFVGNTAAFGGAMRNAASHPTMTNCSFIGNTAGTYCGGVNSSATSFPLLVNCILWGNSADLGTEEEWQVGGGFIGLAYSCVQGLSGSVGGAGNIGDDPLLVGGGDVHLQAGSPCINAANNSAPTLPVTDFEGDARVQECRVDMGADETPFFFDCNTNGTADACDLDGGGSTDANSNGVPDECDECVVNGDCNDGVTCTDDTCDVDTCVLTSNCGAGEWCDTDGDACVLYGDGDFEPDGDVDIGDYARFQACFGQLGLGVCAPANMTGAGTVELEDFTLFVAALGGP